MILQSSSGVWERCPSSISPSQIHINQLSILNCLLSGYTGLPKNPTTPRISDASVGAWECQAVSNSAGPALSPIARLRDRLPNVGK